MAVYSLQADHWTICHVDREKENTPLSSVALQVRLQMNRSTNVDPAAHRNTPFRHALISAAL